MSSSDATTSHLPNELLSEILQNIGRDHNTRNVSLHNVSLTCRHFHTLAQPLIFRCLELDCDSYCSKDDLSRQSARLDFYSSDAIAPFVRELCMGGSMGEENLNVVAKMFRALHRFINIRSLTYYQIHFTPSALHQVSTLHSLECLFAMQCSAPPKTESLPMLCLRVFECTADSVDRAGVRHWFPLLDPNYLQVVEMPLVEDMCSFFLADDNPSPCPFPSLHALHLMVRDNRSLPVLPKLLCRIPALRSLTIDLYISPIARIAWITRITEELLPPPPTACPAPNLEKYNGPHKLLPMVLGLSIGSSSAHLRCLILRSVSNPGDGLDDFVNSLSLCPPLHFKVLTFLYIPELESMDLKSLAQLLDMLPALEQFYLHASEGAGPSMPVSWMIRHTHDVDWTDLYTMPWPTTLVSLSIQWTSDTHAVTEIDLVAAKDRLVLRLPNLRRLWLFNLATLGLIWSRIGSRLEERCLLHEAGSRDDAWAMRQVVFPGH